MFRIVAIDGIRAFSLCVLVLVGSVCHAAERLDPAKYITVDEIRPGMQAYCLTVYRGTEVEKFDLEILDVIRNMMPGRDAIMVKGTDERFIHTGPVAGCSGSPVYVDGRLAGALAFARYFSKDPVYGVTPIEEMLRVGRGTSRPAQADGGSAFAFDFSRPIDFAEIVGRITEPSFADRGSPAGTTALPCPLVTSGLPDSVVEQLDTSVRPYGFMAVAGIGGSASSYGNQDIRLVPGACLVVPLASGDIAIEVVGTVTEIVGDDVYGFGHSFLGYGPVDLPMATGRVHTVVSNVVQSFKLASAVEIVGALTADESTAVYGRVGAEARMIPLKMRVDRYNDAETRVYNCRLANNRFYTPRVLRWSMAGATLMLGMLPPDHTIEYKVTIDVENVEPITLENVSSSLGLDEMLAESMGSVALLMNNPYKTVNIRSIETEVRIVPESVVSRIWSVDLSDSKVRPGEEIEIAVVLESRLAKREKYEGSLRIPDHLPPGKYGLLVCGGYEYLRFLTKAAPHRFVPENLSGLIEAMNNILRIRRDRLYCLLGLPAGGVTVEKAELPDLPATKALIFQDAKRAMITRPYQHWVEKSFPAGMVTIDKKTMQITVVE